MGNFIYVEPIKDELRVSPKIVRNSMTLRPQVKPGANYLRQSSDRNLGKTQKMNEKFISDHNNQNFINTGVASQNM